MRFSKALINKYGQTYMNIGHQKGQYVVLWHYNPKTGFDTYIIESYDPYANQVHEKYFYLDRLSFSGRYDPKEKIVSIGTPRDVSPLYLEKTLIYVEELLKEKFGNDIQIAVF